MRILNPAVQRWLAFGRIGSCPQRFFPNSEEGSQSSSDVLPVSLVEFFCGMGIMATNVIYLQKKCNKIPGVFQAGKGSRTLP